MSDLSLAITFKKTVVSLIEIKLCQNVIVLRIYYHKKIKVGLIRPQDLVNYLKLDGFYQRLLFTLVNLHL